MKSLRSLFILVVVFALLSSPLFALPAKGKPSSKASEASSSVTPLEVQEKPTEAPATAPAEVQEAPTAPATEELAKNSDKDLRESYQKLLESYEALMKTLNDYKIKPQNAILKAEELQKDYELIKVDIEETEARLAELEANNSKQADELAYIKGRYDKAVSSRIYSSLNFVLGGKVVAGDFVPTWGIGIATGLRLGNHLTVGVGANYAGMEFTLTPDLTPHLSQLSVVSSIGWEW